MKYLGVILVGFAFILGTMLAPLAMLLTLPWRGDVVFRSMNRLCGAAYFGFDGKNTISKECGLRIKAGVACALCKRLCGKLNKLLRDPDHCENEAKHGHRV